MRDDIIDVAKTMVGLEERFIDLAFGMGEIQGMTPDAIKAYIRYIADWRLTQLKLSPVFGTFEETATGYRQLKEHPLPWLVEYPQRRRARQLLRAARHGIFQGRDHRFVGWRSGRLVQLRQAQSGCS